MEIPRSESYKTSSLVRSSSDDQGIYVSAVLNENWRGKNDPAERRRIQNRLNQRAFRQRQRSGASPKAYKRRSVPGGSSQGDPEDDYGVEDELGSPTPEVSSPRVNMSMRSISAPTGRTPNGVLHEASGLVWDELAQLINRNLMAAATTNAQHLGISMTALRNREQLRTPRTTTHPVPESLIPVELQYQVKHDPMIDILPHGRLRFNILRAIARGELDAVAFSSGLRASGALETRNGSWQRGGLVVWSFPEQVASWELSETFVRKWAALLQGCEDLVAATNMWRSRRGEKPFALSSERNSVLMSH